MIRDDASPGDGPSSPNTDGHTAAQQPAVPQLFLATPADWARLDLSRDGIAEARRMVEAIAEGSGPDKQKLKLQVAASLQSVVRKARRQGGIMAAFWSKVAEGQVMGASVIAAIIPLDRAAVRPDRTVDLARAVRTAVGVVSGDDRIHESGVVELPAGPAFRVRKSQRARAVGNEYEAEVVQYVTPVPGCLNLLVLTFSTPSLPLAEPLVELFDALASTVRWRS